MKLQKMHIVWGVSAAALLAAVGASAQSSNASARASAKSTVNANSNHTEIVTSTDTDTANNNTSNKNKNLEAREQKKLELQEQKQTQLATRLRTRIDSAIQKRIVSMERLETRLKSMTRVGDSVKSAIEQKFAAATKGLEDLQVQAKNETDPEKLKEIANKVVWDYRIYRVEIPRAHGLIAASSTKTVIEKITASIPKIESALEVARQKGQNTESLQEELTSIKAELATILENIKTAESEFNAMKPAKDTAESDKHLAKGKEIMQASKRKLIEIKNRLKKMLPGMKEMVKKSVPATPEDATTGTSVTPTTSAETSPNTVTP